MNELSGAECQDCLRLFGFCQDDDARMAEVRDLLAPMSEALVEKFYDHLGKFPEMDPFFAGAERLARLKQSQMAYVASLGDFRQNDPASVVAYFERRHRVGLAHFRVGLDPKLYMGAYSFLGQLALGVVAASGGPTHLAALHKTLLLDAHLAMAAYEATRGASLAAEATRDDLCGILTRKPTVGRLREELERARRFNHAFSILFIDVDRFKTFNDTYGHAAGDTVLRGVSDALVACVRPMDIVGRYAGDEFIVGLVEADASHMRNVAHRVRESVLGLCVGEQPVTLSIGGASFAHDAHLEALIARADRAMYEAKRLGRNQFASG